jgi:hypothetical protein
MSIKKDFFISYTKNDEQWAMWIAGTLENEGYKTIIQVWDFKAGENFVLNMNNALINTERFIAVLSEKYLESLYCQSEWSAAFTKDPNSEKALFVPVRITNVKPEGLLAAIVYIDLFGLDYETAERKLLQGVNLSASPRNRPSFPGTKRTRFPGEIPLNNLPHSRNPYFTGREESLNFIRSNFIKNDMVSLVQSVSGLGGVGKTSVALEYSYRYSHEYETIWWVNAESVQTALPSLRDFALIKSLISKEGKQKDILDAMKYWFNNNSKWLFIYDNADSDDFDKWLEPFLPQGRNGHVLITTRSTFFPKSELVNMIVFNDTEAISFLKIRTRKSGDGYSDDLAEKLSIQLQYLPLALEQAAAYIIETPGVTYKDYIDLIEKYGTEIFKKKII